MIDIGGEEGTGGEDVRKREIEISPNQVTTAGIKMRLDYGMTRKQGDWRLEWEKDGSQELS